MIVGITVEIPHHESGTHVRLPKGLSAWRAQCQHQLDEFEHLYVNIDTMAMGCGNIGVTFGAATTSLFDEEAFGFIIDKNTARELVQALELAIRHAED